MAWSLSDPKVKTLTEKSKQKNFLLISEIKHFKDPTLQWLKRQNVYV